MGTKAGSVMQSSVVSVDPETPLSDVQRLFVEEEIHGAPVVGEDGSVLGVITSQDVLRALDAERDTAVVDTSYFRDSLEFSGPDWRSMPEDFQDRLAQLTAADAMTREVVTVGPSTPVSEVAAALRRNRIHRVFVVEDGELLGIVTSFDLLACLEKVDA